MWRVGLPDKGWSGGSAVLVAANASTKLGMACQPHASATTSCHSPLPAPSGPQARILVHGKVTHLGYYETEEEAARVYDK